MRNGPLLCSGPSRPRRGACQKPKRNRSTPVGAFPRCAHACRGNAVFLDRSIPWFQKRAKRSHACECRGNPVFLGNVDLCFFWQPIRRKRRLPGITVALDDSTLCRSQQAQKRIVPAHSARSPRNENATRMLLRRVFARRNRHLRPILLIRETPHRAEVGRVCAHCLPEAIHRPIAGEADVPAANAIMPAMLKEPL